MARLVPASLLVLALVPAASAAVPATVAVRLGDVRVTLSPTSAPVGTVRFSVVNTGTRARVFAVANRRTPVLKPGKRATLIVRFARSGTYRFTIASRGRVPRHGSFRVTPPSEAEPPAAAPPVLVKVGDFRVATDVDAPPGDEHRLMVVEQAGLIHLLVDGVRASSPFLDLTDRVVANGEDGLLSVAFAPDYAASGRLYVFFNDRAGNINIEEFRRDALDPGRVDPESARRILYRVKLASNHNGGMLQFGPDGALYASVGDGGAPSLVQSRDTVWGKLLRIDVESGAYAIVARGFRNPWRFWIDERSGETLVADVGQERREEIDVVPPGSSDLDFGWPCFEGTVPWDAAARCSAPVPPLYEYAHGEAACSITGGPIVSDPRLPALAGAFLFGDFCGNTLWALRRGAAATAVAAVGVRVERPVAFGVDGLGRVHVSTVAGAVYRLDPPP